MLIKFSDWVSDRDAFFLEARRKKPSDRKKNAIKNTTIDSFLKAAEELEKDLDSLEKAKKSNSKSKLKSKKEKPPEEDEEELDSDEELKDDEEKDIKESNLATHTSLWRYTSCFSG